MAVADGDGGDGGREEEEEGWNPDKKRWLAVAREERPAQANGQEVVRAERGGGPVARFFAQPPAHCPPLLLL